MEIGFRFWRHQFTTAMKHRDIHTGRAIYDSLQTLPATGVETFD